MYFNEELLTDERYLKLNAHQQSDLIVQHCTDIKDRIRTAPSRLEAVRIKELACTRFEQSCPSDLVRKALVRHVEEIIAQYWNDK